MESAGSSFSASSKRAKAPGNFTQVAQCLVDYCNADLSLCRDYHRRHKVCEAHSKHPKVTIGGREQRFCQQCSRFHSLVEFDEGKRSCRKRLDGHNRRRRKPQPDRNSGLVFTSTQPSSRLLSFSSPQILPSSMLSSSWSGAAEMQYNNQMNYMDRQNAFPEGYRAVNQQLQLGDFLDPTRKIYSDDSDRALSLLSPALHQVAHPEPVHYSHHYPYLQGANPTHSNAPDSHVPGAFPSASEGSSTAAGSHQTLTFMWE